MKHKIVSKNNLRRYINRNCMRLNLYEITTIKNYKLICRQIIKITTRKIVEKYYFSINRYILAYLTGVLWMIIDNYLENSLKIRTVFTIHLGKRVAKCPIGSVLRVGFVKLVELADNLNLGFF